MTLYQPTKRQSHGEYKQWEGCHVPGGEGSEGQPREQGGGEAKDPDGQPRGCRYFSWWRHESKLSETSWLCLLTFIITKGTVNNTCLMGISGSYGERGVPCVAAGLRSGWQRTNAGPTNSLSLDWRRQGGLHLWIFQQLGQQDSPH